MRHRVHHRKFNRTSEHRQAMLRNMAQNLFEHGQIKTTLTKAKDLRPFCERLITLAVKSRRYTDAQEPHRALAARRAIHRLLGERSYIPADHRQDYNDLSDAGREKTLRMASGRRHRTGDPSGRLAFTGASITHRLINTVAPRFEDRPGGYTRIIKLPKWRIGDAAPLAVLQLVGNEQDPGPLARPEKTSRQRRADARYAFAIKTTRSARAGAKAAPATPTAVAEPPVEKQDDSPAAPPAE